MPEIEKRFADSEPLFTGRDLAEVVSFVSEVLDKADIIARKHFFSEVAIERKADGTAVTVADRSIEAILRQELLARYPDDSFLGEEYGAVAGSSEYEWIIDPIDGTSSFVNGLSDWGILVGLMHKGRPIFGAISQPVTEERIWGDGERACYNGSYLTARPPEFPLSDSIVLTTNLSRYHEFASRERLEALVARCKTLRSVGNCYGYLKVATQQAQIMLDPIMAPWDLLPLIPIMNGAGICITGFNGQNPIGAGSAVASGPNVHREVVSILNGG